MILSHEDGNTSYVKNIHKPTVWPAAGCIYSRCVALIVIIMLFTKACLGSGFADLSNVCGPLFYPVKFKNQCLYLDDRLTRNICDTPRTFLGLPNNPIHLKFCNKYTLNHILPQDSPWDGRRVGGGCNETMIELVNSDNRAREEFELFVSLLERVDCDSVYSVTWGCSICQVSTFHSFFSLSFFLDQLQINHLHVTKPADLFVFIQTTVVYLLPAKSQLTVKSVAQASGSVAELF